MGLFFCLYQELKLGKLFIHNSDTRQFQVLWSVAQKYIKQDIKKTQTLNLNIYQRQHLCFRRRPNRKTEPWSCSLPTHRENILAVFHSYRSVQCFTIWVCLMKLSAIMTIFGCTPEVCNYSFAVRFAQGVIPEWKKFQMS